jgi:hypothetical protein
LRALAEHLPAPFTGLEVVVRDNAGEVGVSFSVSLLLPASSNSKLTRPTASQPIALHISSPHLTVASLCFLNISFLSPPALEILSVGAYILQSFSITYFDASVGRIYPPRQKKVRLFPACLSCLPGKSR